MSTYRNQLKINYLEPNINTKSVILTLFLGELSCQYWEKERVLDKSIRAISLQKKQSNKK